MLRTRAGFAKLTEAVEVVYDGEECSFESLLSVYWQHDMRGICVYDDEQRQAAESEKARHRGCIMKITGPCFFISARRGSQKALLQFETEIFEALKLKSKSDIVSSWPAARLNGFVSGYGTPEQLEREWSEYGIADAQIKEKVRRRCGQRL